MRVREIVSDAQFTIMATPVGCCLTSLLLPVGVHELSYRRLDRGQHHPLSEWTARIDASFATAPGESTSEYVVLSHYIMSADTLKLNLGRVSKGWK